MKRIIEHVDGMLTYGGNPAPQVKHTPTPWKLAADGRTIYTSMAQGFPDNIIASTARSIYGQVGDPKANAEHIVRCVNSHDALLEACQRALALDTSVTQGEECELREGYRNMLRAAIACAQGGVA